MARIIQREWTSDGPLGRPVRHVAHGYTLTVNGKRERKFSSEWLTKTDALAALNQRMQAIQSGEMARRPEISFQALSERYLKYKTDQGKRSMKDDTRILRHRLLPYFGPTLPVRHLTEERIAQYEAGRIGEVSPYTVCNELSILRHALHLAKKWGYLDREPAIEFPKKPEGRKRYLTEEELGRLLQACATSRNTSLLAIVVLAVNTGMRKREILTMTWEHVDLTSDYGINARVELHQTKNGKPRGVPLNRVCVDVLTELEPNPEQRVGPLFKGRDGMAKTQMRTAFETACKRAGILHCRFHDLRHTAASHFVMRGRSLQEVKEVLGHSDFRMTLRYAHLSPQHLRSAVEALDGLTPLPEARHTAIAAHNRAQIDEQNQHTFVTH
jgi:integrase